MTSPPDDKRPGDSIDVHHPRIPDVQGLTAMVVDGGVRLWWEWPEGCETVRLVRRQWSWPEERDCAASDRLGDITRSVCDLQGESFLDEIWHRSVDLCYVAYAKVGGEFSVGASEGSRVRVKAVCGPSLEIEVQTTRGGLNVRWRLDPPVDGFGGLVIVGNQSHPPLNTGDGTRLAEWAPRHRNPQELAGWKESPAPLPAGSKILHYRVFLLNPRDNARIRVIDPNGGVIRLGRRWGGWRARRFDGVSASRPRGIREFPCPHCFETVPIWEMRLRKDRDDEETYALPDAKRARRDPNYRLGTAMPRGPDGKRFRHKVCPHGCRRELPLTTGAQRSIILGLVGGRQVGKTHFVVSLVKRARHLRDFDMRHLDDITLKRYEQMERRLYGDRQQLPATPAEEEALIYSLTPPGDPADRSCTLALYDTAGEFFGTGQDVTERTRYLSVADGLILLIDPLQCESLARELGGKLLGKPATTVLGNVVNLLKARLDELKEGDRIPTPLAVTLTKADVLVDAVLIDRHALWHTHVFHEGSYNLHLHHNEDSVFGNLVRSYGDGLLDMIEKNFSDYAFFGVSATGSSPNAHGEFQRVVPRRVEEPMLWLLYRLGVLEGR